MHELKQVRIQIINAMLVSDDTINGVLFFKLIVEKMTTVN
jgi:hypothetical protein